MSSQHGQTETTTVPELPDDIVAKIFGMTIPCMPLQQVAKLALKPNPLQQDALAYVRTQLTRKLPTNIHGMITPRLLSWFAKYEAMLPKEEQGKLFNWSSACRFQQRGNPDQQFTVADLIVNWSGLSYSDLLLIWGIEFGTVPDEVLERERRTAYPSTLAKLAILVCGCPNALKKLLSMGLVSGRQVMDLFGIELTYVAEEETSWETPCIFDEVQNFLIDYKHVLREDVEELRKAFWNVYQ